LVLAAGPPDVLINVAGYAVLDLIEDANPETLHDMMDTNYFGALWCIKAALPAMLERGNGSIINLASITGIMGVSRMGGYGATKGAMITLTEALRDEVIGRGINVSLVCPATTETEFFVRAEHDKVPAASRLLPSLTAEQVARAICDAAESGRYRSILPWHAAFYMRFKELFPRLAHLLMRSVSSLLEHR
jgi:short-subunit dehydrogenase